MKLRAFILVLLAASSVACVLPDQLSDIQQDVNDLRQQMVRNERDQQEAADQLQALSVQSRDPGDGVTRAEVADLMVRLDRVTREMAMTDQQVQDLNQRMDRFSQDLQQARQLARTAAVGGPGFDGEEPVGSDPRTTPSSTAYGSDGTDGAAGALGAAAAGAAGATSSALPDPESLYNTAYADFSKGNFALAVSGFEEYHQRFPDSALADNALYWIGECHFSQGNYPLAIDAFDRLLDRYPRSDKAPGADLKKALAFMEQNQVGQAIVQLRYVLSSYPRSDEARIARDKLSGLGATPN